MIYLDTLHECGHLYQILEISNLCSSVKNACAKSIETYYLSLCFICH